MSQNPSGTAVGFTVFAGTVMIIVGVLHAIQGLVALFNDTFYVVGQEYVFQFDVTTWGWIHLLLGILVGFAGFFIFRGAVWAAHDRRHHRRAERDRELCLAAVLPRLEPDHHRPRRVRHLGPHRARSGHHRVRWHRQAHRACRCVTRRAA